MLPAMEDAPSLRGFFFFVFLLPALLSFVAVRLHHICVVSMRGLSSHHSISLSVFTSVPLQSMLPISAFVSLLLSFS